MDFLFYKEHFTEGSIGRYDMAPLYADPILFNKLIEDIIAPFNNVPFDKIISIDATGFILGAAVSAVLGKGLILVRKGNKIPIESSRKICKNFIDYTGNKKSLEINKSMINKDFKYLIIDDWVETGTQVKSVISMIEELGGLVSGISCIGSDRNDRTEQLFTEYNLKSIGVNV